MEENVLNILPAIAVRGIIPIPNNEFRIEVGRDISLRALEVAEQKFDNEVILLIQKNPLDVEIKSDDVEQVGVLARISLKLKMQNNNYKVKFKIIQRINIENFEYLRPFFMVQYSKAKTYIGETDEVMALLRRVVADVVKNAHTVLTAPEEVQKMAQSGAAPEVLADVIAFHLKTVNNKYRYISEPQLTKRLTYILEDVQREIKISEIESKINADVKKSIDESQKEYYLREKMKAIQNELGDKARQDEEIEKMRERIEKAQMPENIYNKVTQELQRYQQTGVQMAESGIIRAWLEFMIELPWAGESEDCDDLDLVSQRLEKNHYGLTKVKERIVEYLAVKIMTKKNPQTIICLAGPPGVGKTSLAISIAEALNRKFVKQSLGGLRDESEIRGHRRTYIGALPGRIMKGMKDAKTLNPVFLLDEIDKMTYDFRGDPASAMLEVLDPEQNSRFSDNYVEEPYDLSKVLFITTANDISRIPAPLRDRMEIIELSSYTEFEKYNIAYQHLIPRQLTNHGLDSSKLVINSDTMYHIIADYTREAGVRELDRMLGTIARKSVKKILIKKEKNVTITNSNLSEFLGKVRYFNNLNRNIDQVGIVTGLAYTQFGGDTLDIEVTYYKGKGGLVLTGKLGDVMKESAQAALSFVRAHSEQFNIDSSIFSENDIHVHVPEGAVPKDGPSAGVTITCAIVSALTNKPCDAHVGMTGEITLRGSILAIGGLKEKAIAAHRSGLKTIMIPVENERDLDDIPQEVKEKLEIIPVSNVLDIINRVLR